MRSLPRLRSRLARDVTLDVLVVLAAVGASLGAALDGQSVLRPFGGATAGALVLAALALAVRRWVPVAVAWTSVAVAGALLAAEHAAPGTLLHTDGRIDAGRIPWWTPTGPFAAYAAMAFSASGRRVWTRWPPVVALVVLVALTPEAPGAQARVEVRYRADGVRLLVRNSPPTAPPDADLVSSGSGAGLEGLRQRVELIGGAFASGGEPGGGFAVEVSLPAYIPTDDRAPMPR